MDISHSLQHPAGFAFSRHYRRVPVRAWAAMARGAFVFAIAILCLGLAGCGGERAPTPAEAKLLALGAKLGRDDSLSGAPVVGVDFGKTSVNNGDLIALRDLPGLQWVFLDETPVTDPGLALVAELKDLQTLSLTGCRITDNGLTPLTEMPKLRRLNLGGTEVTDIGVQIAERIPGLRILDLKGATKVTDVGVQSLRQRHPKLVVLY